MKTIMIIDGADNCAYDCFLASNELFKIIFSADGQDIEFFEDLSKRVNFEEVDPLFTEMWENPISKKNVQGIHGILFYDLIRKKEFYPNKRDTDLDEVGRSFSIALLPD